MSKINLDALGDLTNEQTAVTTINSNNLRIEDAFDNTLSRDGTGPNAMGSDLDMNSHRVMNLPAAVSAAEPVRKTEFENGLYNISSATSSSLVTVGTGTQVFTTQSGRLAFIEGQFIVIFLHGTPATYMSGQVVSYIQSGNDATLTVDVQVASGSGSYSLWDIALTGTPGSEGAAGAKGDTGAQGAQGVQGTAATIAVGTVTTGAAGSSVIISNSGTSSDAVLDFTIPRGDTGASGSGTGDMLSSVYDPNGKAADAFSQDNMVDGATNKNYTATEKTKLAGIASGAEVNVNADWNSVSGDSQILNKPTLGTAAAENTSAFASAAQAVPAGGTTGQVLAKASGTDNDTSWVDQSGGRPLLSADLNYYVRTDGSDSNNGLANTSGGAFLTVSAALAAAKLNDPNGHKIKINAGAGVFSSTSTNDLTGYFSKDIQILGATPVSLTISSFGSASGSSRNWSVVINVTDASSVTVGDYAIIRSPTGTGAKEVHCGCWEVTAKTSTSVTLKNKYYGSAFPTNTLTGGTFTIIKTVLKFTGCNGFQGGSFGKIDQVAIVGNNTAGSFGLLPADVSNDLSSSISLNLGTNVGVAGFDIGMVAHFGVSIHAASIVCSDFSTYGLSAQHGGTIFANNGIVSGGSSTNYNVMSQYGASIYFEGGLTLGAFRGVQAQLGGNILFKSGTALLCDNAGAGASFNGTIQAEFATLTNNRNYGGVAEDDGVLYADQSSITSNDANGLFSDGGKIMASSSDITGNGANAISCTNSGRVKAVGANLHSQNVFANKGAWVNLQGATNLGTLTPAANTLGGEQAYIDT